MSLSSQFKTNKTAEVEGVEVQYSLNKDGSFSTFRISRMGRSNKNYTKALERATRPYRRVIELGTMDNEIAESLFMKVFVESVLIDWKNIPLSDVTGNDRDEGYAPYSRENAVKLFNRLPDLYEDLQEKANSAAMFREDTMEQEAGN